MDRNEKRQDLEAKLAQCRRLASQFPEGITADNLRALAGELEQKLRELDEQGCPQLAASSARSDLTTTSQLAQ